MISSVLRKTLMTLAVPAVIAASSTSPAMASSYGDHDDDDSDSVHIKVCKVVKDDHHGHYNKWNDDDDDDDTKFTIHVKTDEDYAKVRVRDGKCKTVELDYDRPRFKVWEDDEDGYEFKYIKCSHGAYKHGDNKCKFDSDDDYVKVTVYNKKDHHHDHGDDDD